MITNAFVKLCVFRLGLIYCALAASVFYFVQHKIASEFWWMNGLVFALSDAKAAVLLLAIFASLFVGLYYWVNSYKQFVLKSELSITSRLYSLCYLSLAPVAAALLTSEIYQIFLISPFAGYQP